MLAYNVSFIARYIFYGYRNFLLKHRPLVFSWSMYFNSQCSLHFKLSTNPAHNVLLLNELKNTNLSNTEPCTSKIIELICGKLIKLRSKCWNFLCFSILSSMYIRFLFDNGTNFSPLIVIKQKFRRWFDMAYDSIDKAKKKFDRSSQRENCVNDRQYDSLGD